LIDRRRPHSSPAAWWAPDPDVLVVVRAFDDEVEPPLSVWTCPSGVAVTMHARDAGEDDRALIGAPYPQDPWVLALADPTYRTFTYNNSALYEALRSGHSHEGALARWFAGGMPRVELWVCGGELTLLACPKAVSVGVRIDRDPDTLPQPATPLSVSGRIRLI
jgi:hypothetical protein